MKFSCVILCATLFMFSYCKEKEKTPLTYPVTHAIEKEDMYFDVIVKDPYRWLEHLDTDSTQQWIANQNKVTNDYFSKIPYLSNIRSRLRDLWNYEKYGAPFRAGNCVYYFRNNGLQNQSALYKKGASNQEDEVFIDPNLFSSDGTISLGNLSFSKDGSLLAYEISEGGSDWRKIVVMDAKSKKIIGDTIVGVKFSNISWNGVDGFYYSSYGKVTGNYLSEKTIHHKLFYHKVGTPQASDVAVFGGEKMPYRYVNGAVTEDQQYLVVEAANTTSGNDLYIKKINDKKEKFSVVVKDKNANFSIVYAEGNKLWISTDFEAPNGKLISCEFGNFAVWKTIIPESTMALHIATAGTYFFAHYLKDATSEVKQFSKEGTFIQSVKLPDVGTASGFSGNYDDTLVYYSFTNYIYPSSIFEINLKNNQQKLYVEPTVKFSTDDYITKQVFYTSSDGVKIPMIISHRKDLNLSKAHPLLLYGYGGFNISITPKFSVGNLFFMEQGGILAVPNIRGGGEYGKNWHLAGTQKNKKQVFLDFIAAAEHLINEGFTSKDLLAIEGRSNGGLLVGACMTMRPDLFKVALPSVGVLDMLRYHQFTSGAGWAYDFGTAQDNKDMFEYLYSYSPLHNVVDTCYPATLVTTADHDDRVVPSHSYKFIAALQAHQQCKHIPTLIAIEKNAGHGAGKPTQYVIEEWVKKWGFLFWNMGIEKLP